MKIKEEFRLPCGAILKNRIAKSAMSENMSPIHHGPTNSIINLYDRWAKGGAGLLLTGNFMIDKNAIAEPGNILVEDKSDIEMLKKWAAITKDTGVHLWPQINHPGRQAIGLTNKNVVAPSAIKVKVKGLSSLFKKPKALTEAEIFDLIERFGSTAKILKQAGFTGVQIHAAHGYLISQFLSPLTNQRNDQWGGSLENRVRFLLEVYKNVRSKVDNDFPVGIKINSADFQRGGFSEEESIQVISILDAQGIDLIEISGGTYEKPAMTGSLMKESTKEREAYFMDYIIKARKLLKAPLMLTGGFRTVSTMNSAINDGKVDIIGLARPFTLYPDLANQIFENKLTYLRIPNPKTGIKVIDKSGFVDLKWHEIHIHRLGKGKEPNPKLNPLKVIGHNFSVTMKNILFGSK